MASSTELSTTSQTRWWSPAGRWSRCTCRAACGPDRGPRGPGCPWRRSRSPEPLARPGRRAVQCASRRDLSGGSDGAGGSAKFQVRTVNHDAVILPEGCDGNAPLRTDPGRQRASHPDLDRTQLEPPATVASRSRSVVSRYRSCVAQPGSSTSTTRRPSSQGDGPGVGRDLGPDDLVPAGEHPRHRLRARAPQRPDDRVEAVAQRDGIVVVHGAVALSINAPAAMRSTVPGRPRRAAARRW